MNSINIQIAGQVIEISSVYRFSTNTYADFRTDKASECVVELKEEDIDYSIMADGPKVSIKMPCVLRKVADALLNFDIILIHGVALAKDGNVYLFTAPSRTGKTTHAEIWLKQIPDVFIVNGDKPFIKFPEDGSQPLVCGSPWAGKEYMYTNTMVPLKAIILMERAEDNHIERISFAEAFPFLLQQVYRPEDEEKMRKTLKLMQRLGKSVTFWRFQCNNFKDDCFQVAYDALVGNTAGELKKPEGDLRES